MSSSGLDYHLGADRVSREKILDILNSEFLIVEAEKRDFMRQMYNVGALMLAGTGAMVSVSAQNHLALMFLLVLPLQLSALILIFYLMAQVLYHSNTLIRLEKNINTLIGEGEILTWESHTPHEFEYPDELRQSHFGKIRKATRFPSRPEQAAMYGFLLINLLIYLAEEIGAWLVIVLNQPSINKYGEQLFCWFPFAFYSHATVNGTLYIAATGGVFLFVVAVFRRMRGVFNPPTKPTPTVLTIVPTSTDTPLENQEELNTTSPATDGEYAI